MPCFIQFSFEKKKKIFFGGWWGCVIHFHSVIQQLPCRQNGLTVIGLRPCATYSCGVTNLGRASYLVQQRSKSPVHMGAQGIGRPVIVTPSLQKMEMRSN